MNARPGRPPSEGGSPPAAAAGTGRSGAGWRRAWSSLRPLLEEAEVRAALAVHPRRRFPKEDLAFVRGYFGVGNLGDELLLGVLRRLLADRGLQLIAASFDPAATRSLHGIEAVRRTSSPLDAWAALPHLRRARLCLLGPGGILQSPSGVTASLRAYALHAATARRAGTPLGLLGVGAGPLSPSAAAMARCLVRSARVALFRDEASRDLVAPGRDAADGVFVGPDLAFLAEPRDPAGFSASGRLGFAPFPARRAAPEFAPDSAADYRAAVAQGLARSTAPGGLRAAAWHLREDGRELEAMRPLLQARGAAPAEEPPPADLETLHAWVASCDLVVVSRFHALVLALLHRKPAVVLAYHPKVRDLAVAAGLGPWTLSLREVTAEALADRIDDARRRRVELAARADAYVDWARTAARATTATALDRLLGRPGVGVEP